MVTIKDVAKAAGVSSSTVSHVLSGNRPISQKTQDKVHAVIKELGYEPNINAQALKSKHSGIIGFFASDITETFANHIVRGVEKVTGENNNHLLFASGREFDYDLHQALNFLKRRNIDGIIVSYETTRKFEKINLDDIDLPIITINHNLSDSIPSVMPDNFKGGHDAAEHLISKGVKVPAIIAGPENRVSTQQRIKGFNKAFEEVGFNVDNIAIKYGDYDFETGTRYAKELLNESSDIDAFFCLNDYIAAGAIDYARRNHFDVPEQIKVVGYDDRDFSAFWPTPITTFTQPLEHMGERSAELLLDLIKGKKIENSNVYMESSLIPRKSSE